MSGLRGLGFGVIVVALTVGVIAGVVTAVQHIPRPATKIEWVQRPDAVIVQMKTDTGGLRQLMVPEFTLYGDGTLISIDRANNQLYKSHISSGEVLNLLNDMRSSGFMDFSYDQPSPRASHQSATYIYVNTRLAANAVRVYDIEATAPGDEAWHQLRELQGIKERLMSIPRYTLNGATKYEPDAVMLLVMATSDPQITDSRYVWLFPSIDLSKIAVGSDIGEKRLEGDLAHQLFRGFVAHGPPIALGGPFPQNGKFYDLGVRPLLPYEENFPEFDTTQ